MKKLLFSILLCFSPIYILAQSSFVYNEFLPMIPGSRELTFEISGNNFNEINYDIWVFYSTNKNIIDNVSRTSINSDIPRGRPVIIKHGNTYTCHFVFPSRNFENTPNKDFFKQHYYENVPGLIKLNYVEESSFSFPQFENLDFSNRLLKKGECVYYRVLKIRRNSAEHQITSTEVFGMPDSYNIAIAGDSYGSGEGAPHDVYEIFSNNYDMWIDCPCHRSKYSGLLKGVKKFIHNYPNIDIDYSFQACSGAITKDLHSNKQEIKDKLVTCTLKIEKELQFKILKKNLVNSVNGHDNINMLIMSIGGNDCGFADVVINFLALPRNLCVESLFNRSVLREYQEMVQSLDNRYESIYNAVGEQLGEYVTVGLCNYPDPTLGPLGRCGDDLFYNSDHPENCASHETDYFFSPKCEYIKIRNEYYLKLIARIRRNCNNLGWNLIDVQNEAGDHGLCNCDDPYYNTLGGSIIYQGDPFGFMHPNENGYKYIYRKKVYDFINNTYYNYQLGYLIGIGLGWVKIPQCHDTRFNIKNSALLEILKGNWKVKERIIDPTVFKILEKLYRFERFIKDGEINKLRTNADFKKIMNNKNFIAEVKKIMIKHKIIGEFTKRKISHASEKEFGPYLTKIVNENKKYFKSDDYKKKVEKFRKTGFKKIKIEEDTLDYLYNKTE